MPKWFLLSLAVGLPSATASTFETSELSVNLEGRQRFRLGDEPKWSEPDYDDSAWNSIAVPGGWMAQGKASFPRRGWYRIRFDWPVGKTAEDQAFVLGSIRSAYEVFLNGELIGTSGGVDKGNVWSQLPRPRIVRIPNRLIRSRENLIAIRVLRLVVDGGVRRGPLGIGDANSLFQNEQAWLRPVLLWEAGFVTFYAASLLYSTMLWTLGHREFKHLLFMTMLAHIGLSHLTQGELLGYLEIETALTRRFSIALDQLFPVTTLLFLKSALAIQLAKVEKWLLAVYIVLCVSWWLNEWTIDNLYFPWLLYSVVAFGCLGLWWTLRALWNRQPDATPLLIGVTGFVVIYWSMLGPSIRSSLFGSGIFHEWFYVPGDWFAWLWIHVCMMFMLATGYVRQRRELSLATSRILAVQEEERSRLSRDLHDSIGQSILAMKLELETMNSTQNDLTVSSGIKNLIENTDELLADVRIVSADLRPAILDQSGLVVALESLAESIQRTAEICISVEAIGNKQIQHATEGHLYRIVQEAITNAIRHGKAKTIMVAIRFQANKIAISVTDDGLGFHVDKSRDGLGIANMKDRVKLLGGQLTIVSTFAKETSVCIEVPNP